jgi:hypothetical protein
MKHYREECGTVEQVKVADLVEQRESWTVQRFHEVGAS